jgi:hypothetical protein
MYVKKGGLDYDVRLYLDPDTFRHVATAYSGTQVFKPFLEETFGDFHTVGGLTIPFSWTMRYNAQNFTYTRDATTTVMPDGTERVTGYSTTKTEVQAIIYEWQYSFRNVQINVPLDAGDFVIK